MKLIDVTVPLDANLPVYPGNTPFTIEPLKRIARGDSSNVSTLHLGAHTGTHVDAPRHFFDDGPGVETLALELLIGRTRVVEQLDRKAIGSDELGAVDLSGDLRNPRMAVTVGASPTMTTRVGLGPLGQGTDRHSTWAASRFGAIRR